MSLRRSLLIAALSSLVILSVYLLRAGEEGHYVDLDTPQELYHYLHWEAPGKMWVSAHRGGPLPGYPENSLQTFAHNLQHGSMLIECDIRKSADGVLLMMHDTDLDRTTTGTGAVGQTPWVAMDTLHLRDNSGQITTEEIPTFTEVLHWTEDKAILTLDVKDDVRFEEVIEAVREAGAEEQVVLITYSLEEAKSVHTLAPDLMLSVGIASQADLADYRAAGIPTSQLLAFTGLSTPPKALLTVLHDAGILAMAATFRTADVLPDATTRAQAYQALFDNGVDIIATDRPQEVLRVAARAESQQDR